MSTFQVSDILHKACISKKEIVKGRSEKWESQHKLKAWEIFLPGMLFPSGALETVLASINRGWLFCSLERDTTGNSSLGQLYLPRTWFPELPSLTVVQCTSTETKAEKICTFPQKIKIKNCNLCLCEAAKQANTPNGKVVGCQEAFLCSFLCTSYSSTRVCSGKLNWDWFFSGVIAKHLFLLPF